MGGSRPDGDSPGIRGPQTAVDGDRRPGCFVRIDARSRVGKRLVARVVPARQRLCSTAEA